MPSFNVIINFSCCPQFKTNPPLHGLYTKRGRRLISAQAARVSLVTAGSRYSHGSARLKDCALTAFSNPSEINPILIYLQLPSLEVARSCTSSCRRMHHTPANHCLLPTSPGTPIRTGEMTRGTWRPLSQMDSLPRAPWWTLPSHISFFPPLQPELITGSIRKIHPSQTISEITYKSLGLHLEVIWSPVSQPLLLRNSKSRITMTLTKPQLEWLSSRTTCNLFYHENAKLLSVHTILAFLVFMPSYLQETPSCYNLSHPSLSCRTSLCSFFSVPGTCCVSPDVICPGINNASSRCKMHEFL